MQYFNRSNGEVDFIKDKLRSEYIPTVRIFSSDYNIQPEPKASFYSLDTEPRSLISEENNYQFFNNENIIYNNTIQICKENNGKIVPTYVKRYEFGKFYPNLTTNFISNKNYYDYKLHEYLGRYLRAYRDFYGIDVMNFYNCFSNRFIDSYILPISLYETPYSLTTTNPNPPASDDNEKVKLGLGRNTGDSQYKLVAFPILFDTNYTVKFYTSAVDEVQYQAVWFNGELPLGAVEVDLDSLDPSSPKTWQPKIYKEQISSTFTIRIGSKNAVDIYYTEINGFKGGLSIHYNSPETIKKALSKQNNLYIFMMFPSSISSPIVVLEQPKFTYALNNELLDLPPTEREQVAFSDTLLEYLTGAVISSADEIHKNVHRIQQKILQENFFKKYGVGGPNYVGADVPNYKFANGIFDEGMQKIIYKAFFNVGVPETIEGTSKTFYPKGYEKLPNFIGLVDKNVEDLIMAVPDDSNAQGGK